MNCAMCEKLLCCHGSNTVCGPMWKCSKCGAIGINGPPPLYCLPTYEGKVTAASDVFSTVCKECHDKGVKNL